MKNVTLAGRLTRDAELRRTGDSEPVLGFSVAVDHRAGREKTTMFFDCSMWGVRGEKLAEYLTKGSAVTVTGDLGTREHNGKTYLTVRVADVTMQGGGKDRDYERDDEPKRSPTAQAAHMAQRPAMTGLDDGDAIPF